MGRAAISRLSEDHPVVKQVATARWQLTQRGFGPWARVYRKAQGRERQCVQLATLSWYALDGRSWPSLADVDAADIARRPRHLRATRVTTPRGFTAVSGRQPCRRERLTPTTFSPTRRPPTSSESWTQPSAPTPPPATCQPAPNANDSSPQPAPTTRTHSAPCDDRTDVEPVREDSSVRRRCPGFRRYPSRGEGREGRRALPASQRGRTRPGCGKRGSRRPNDAPNPATAIEP